MRARLMAVAVATALAMPAAVSAQETSSEADAINASGRIAGSVCSPTCNDGYVAALFDKRGGFTPLGTLGGFAAVFGDLSENGWGVGQADEAALHPSGTHISKAFILDGFALRSLGTLPGYAFSQAYGVNEKGEAVGWSYNLEDSGLTMQTFRAFVTAPRGGAMRELGTLGGPTSIARDITEDGRIVGGAAIADGRTRAFLYEEGHMTELPSLGGGFAEANAINAGGQMAGSATYPGQPNNRRRAVMWDADGIHDLGTLGGQVARAWGINQRGEIVGQAQTADGATHAVLWRNTISGRSAAATPSPWTSTSEATSSASR